MFRVSPTDGRGYLWFKLIANGVGFIAFLLIIPIGISHFYTHWSVQQWSETTMTVISAKEGNGKRVNIQYEFEVDGGWQSGEDIVEYFIPTEIKTIKQTYAPGSEHPVFYDATAPIKNSMRPTSKSWGLLLGVVLGIYILVQCAIGFYRHYRAIFMFRP